MILSRKYSALQIWKYVNIFRLNQTLKFGFRYIYHYIDGDGRYRVLGILIVC